MLASISDGIRQLFDLKAAISEAEKKIAEMKADRQRLENELAQKMEEQGVDTSGVDGIGRIFAEPKIFFTCPPESVETMIQYFKADPQLRPLVKETVHPKTFQSAMESFYQQKGLVPEFVRTYAKTVIKTRKASTTTED